MSTSECLEYSQKYANAQSSKDRNEARGELMKQIDLTVAEAVAAEGDRYTREIERLRGVLVAIARHSVFTVRTNSKDCDEWAEDMAFVGKLACGH